MAVETAAVAAVAAAVEAARGDLGVPSEEGNGSEVGPSPSELDCGSTDRDGGPAVDLTVSIFTVLGCHRDGKQFQETAQN